MSLLFKRMGKQVVYNDYSYYNYLAGIAFIENREIKLDDEDLKFLLEKRNNSTSFISENFKDIYFYDNENEWLDQTIGNILALEDKYNGATLKYKQALAIWALGQACLIKRPFNLFHRVESRKVVSTEL